MQASEATMDILAWPRVSSSTNWHSSSNKSGSLSNISVFGVIHEGPNAAHKTLKLRASCEGCSDIRVRCDRGQPECSCRVGSGLPVSMGYLANLARRGGVQFSTNTILYQTRNWRWAPAKAVRTKPPQDPNSLEMSTNLLQPLR